MRTTAHRNVSLRDVLLAQLINEMEKNSVNEYNSKYSISFTIIPQNIVYLSLFLNAIAVL